MVGVLCVTSLMRKGTGYSHQDKGSDQQKDKGSNHDFSLLSGGLFARTGRRQGLGPAQGQGLGDNNDDDDNDDNEEEEEEEEEGMPVHNRSNDADVGNHEHEYANQGPTELLSNLGDSDYPTSFPTPR